MDVTSRVEQYITKKFGSRHNLADMLKCNGAVKLEGLSEQEMVEAVLQMQEIVPYAMGYGDEIRLSVYKSDTVGDCVFWRTPLGSKLMARVWGEMNITIGSVKELATAGDLAPFDTVLQRTAFGYAARTILVDLAGIDSRKYTEGDLKMKELRYSCGYEPYTYGKMV